MTLNPSKERASLRAFGRAYDCMYTLIASSLILYNKLFIASFQYGLCAVLCLVAQSCPISTPWTVTHQAPLSMGTQARILEWVAMPSSRGSSQPRDRNQVSLIWAVR